MIDEEELKELNNILHPTEGNRFNKNSKNTQTIKFSSYNVPKFLEKPFKKWIMAGPDNLYPNYLVDNMNKCGIHAAILESKVKQIIGEGWYVQDSQDKDQLSELNDFMSKIEANKILRRIAFDYELFGYFFLGITWSNDRTKIANIFHVDASTVRVGMPQLQDNGFTREVEHFYYSEDWSKYKKKDFRPDEIPVFDPNRRIEPTSLMMVRGYRPNTRFYNLPSYIGAMNSIELTYEISNYMLNNVKNGLSPSLLFNFYNGIPSEEEQLVVYNQINGLYGGTDNSGKFIMNFSNGKDNAAEITPIETSNLSQLLANLSEYATNDIVRAHRVPNPVLVGIAVPGQLGLTNEISESSELFTNEVIYPVQLLLEETLQELLKINGFGLKVSIKDSRPISFTYEDNTLLNVLTLSELRERIGYAPLSESDKANLGVNVKTEGGAGGKEAKPANPKAITQEEKVEQGMEDETEDDNTISEAKLKAYEIMRSLTGKQRASMEGIIRKYKKGILARQQAYIQLMPFLMDDEAVEGYLGEEPKQTQLTINELEQYVLAKKNNMNTNISSLHPYVDQTKKRKITSPDKLI